MNPEIEKDRTYEIFARINRGDNLMHIGTVEAKSDELAIAYAHFVYDEEDWTDMFAVRRDHLITIKRTEPLFDKEGKSA